MVTIGNDSTEQKEQFTSETSVEVSQGEKEVEEVLNDSKKNQEILGVNYTATTESEELEKGVAKTTKDKAIASVEEYSQKNSQTIENEVLKNLSLAEIKNVVAKYDNEKLKVTINDLLKKYKNLSKGIKSTEGSGSTKKDLRHRLYENIKSLNEMKDDLNKINYSNLDTYKGRVGELMYYFEHYEQIRQIVVLGGRTSDIHAIIDSKQDARYAKRQENKDAKYQSSMNDILHEAALTSLWNDDMERYEEYLEAVLNGQVEPSSHPFYAAHKQSFAMIQATSPNLYGALVPSNRGGQVPYEVYCQQNGIPCRPNGLDPNRRYRTGTIGDDIASMIEDHQRKNGKEVNPQQREARRKIGNIGSIVGCIALGVGIFKEIFNPGKDKDGNKKRDWGKILGFGASIYGITHYKDVKNIFFDAFNLDPDNYVARRQDERAREEAQNNTGLSQSETNELINAKIAYPTLVATTIGTIPIKQLVEQKIVEEKDGKLVLNRTNYATYVENIALALGRSDKDKQEMLDKIASDEAARSISYGLSYCGINTLEDLRKLKGSSDKSTLMDSATFKKLKTQIDAITQKTGIFANMAKQGLVPVGLDETIKILENYDSNKNENEQILERLKASPCLLKTSPDKQYDVSDMLSSPYRELMDLDKMTMKGFTNGANEVIFSSYGELFEAVYTTERIKYIFKGRTDAKDAAPFHVNLRGQIEFNNTEWYELHKNETAVLSLKKLKTDLPTIRKNVDAYNDYLNKWWLSQIGT